MKKFKRIVLSALAVVMLFCVTAAPASAATETYSCAGKELGYTYSGSMKLEAKRVILQLETVYTGPGVILANPTVRVSGYISDTNGNTLSYDEIGIGNTDDIQSPVSLYFIQPVRGGTSTEAYCKFYVNGYPVAEHTLP